ncbi:HD-GYP domain-containing protein [Parashewanella spongiae]|uniref:HD-GYP domain-containing protein n=1 Tax=Parashewanella spongiae TaxID=342950 RepID=A0A3A6TAS2_9GAMM|nr:HD-GYP domain-containing protein [Parashewanella spongiae]MCL1079780.1 HD domain-containing protein [Parashewanella spongiae]RJY06492.1 HD-GYP domain-containing protein [Parashewanella spongiae]
MGAKTSVKLPVSKLKIGQTVKLPLSWTNHPFLRNRVLLKSATEIEMIKGLGVPYVLLLSGELEEEQELEPSTADDKSAEKEPVSVAIDESLLLKKSVRLSQNRFNQSVVDNKTVHSKVVTDPEGAYRLSAAMVEHLVEHMLEVKQPYLTLVESFDGSVSVTQHCVSVTVISMMIGRSLQLDNDLLRDIALGSLMHDYGKFKVPDSILRKKGELTQSERNFFNLHPNYGVNVLSETGHLSDVALKIVEQHHEYMDGSGYPKGLKGKQISLPSQIVSLANEFDNLLADQRFPTPQIALGHMFKNGASRHSAKLISSLVKIMGIYPPGTLVQLSDDSFGKVMITTESVKQPNVLTCDVEGNHAKLRLLSQENLSIKKVITIDDLKETVANTLKAYSPISFYFTAGSA